jgi:hypothetical protein
MKTEDKVLTPRGPGVVWQVFEHRIAVVLDGAPDKVAFFTPTEVKPR